MKPCLTCGEPSPESRCDEHRADDRTVKVSPRTLGYDSAWDRLSRRARRLQPFCSDCYTTDDLTTDHSAKAWQRKAEGKPIRLRDVDVVCRSCNSKRGTTRGRAPTEEGVGLRGEAKSPLHIEPLQAAMGSHAAGARAVDPIGTADDLPAADGADAGLAELALQTPPQHSQVRFSGLERVDPAGKALAVEIVDAAVHLDSEQGVSASVDTEHDLIHDGVRVPPGRLPHVTSIAVTRGKP